MTNNEQVIKPVKESLFTRLSRVLLPVFLFFGGLYLFQPHIGLVGDGQILRGIGLSWENPLLRGEQRHGLVVGSTHNADGQLTGALARSW